MLGGKIRIVLGGLRRGHQQCWAVSPRRYCRGHLRHREIAAKSKQPDGPDIRRICAPSGTRTSDDGRQGGDATGPDGRNDRSADKPVVGKMAANSTYWFKETLDFCSARANEILVAEAKSQTNSVKRGIRISCRRLQRHPTFGGIPWTEV